MSQANSWCNQAKTPLLVPLTSWLSLTLPPQVTSMSLPSPLKHLVAVPDSQHVFCTTEADNRVISMYHVTSKKLVRQLSGEHVLRHEKYSTTSSPPRLQRLTHSVEKPLREALEMFSLRKQAASYENDLCGLENVLSQKPYCLIKTQTMSQSQMLTPVSCASPRCHIYEIQYKTSKRRSRWSTTDLPESS